MYRWLRCTWSRRLTLCVVACLVVTLKLWFRCDDVTSRDHTWLLARSQYTRNIVSIIENDYPENMASTDEGDVYPGAQHVNMLKKLPVSNVQSIEYHAIDCVINGEYTVSCRQDDNGEVYLPFTFISKYFEIYGKMAESGDRFIWQHSYSRVYPPEQKYAPAGVFMSFEHYNVEVRERVKCISAAEGVPVSTQWGPQGYFYPTQIAQYGLSHYSKFVKSDSAETNDVVMEDAEDGSTNRWISTDRGTVGNVFDVDTHSRVIEFHSSESLSSKPEVTLVFPNTQSGNLFLSFDIRFVSNGSITVIVETLHHRTLRVCYVCSNVLLSTADGAICLGIGTNRTSWGTIGRDMAVDVQKGIGQQYLARKKHPPRVTLRRIVGIELRGFGYIDNVTVAAAAHLMQFFYAADWFVRHQDQRGGWPISVVRSLADGRLTLAPGWYSAMAQGQAMSVLVRAYARTGRLEYSETAGRALALFDVAAIDGGVVAHFMDRHVWYEEYPTSPPCFVLNGFMYALIGLYDVAKTAVSNEHQKTASRLFDAGIGSLRVLLPLFDTGSGTVYDLRHVTIGGGTTPNRARWDYHTTHINQLLLLASLLHESDEVTATEFEAIAHRWIGYMKGKLAPHN